MLLLMLLTARQITGRAAGLMAVTAVLAGGVATSPAMARQPVVRAHIALGCETGARQHTRHHHRVGSSRCVAALQSHDVLAHAA